MSDTFAPTRPDLVGLDYTLPDTATAADIALSGALTSCAEKMRLEGPDAVVAALKRNDPTAQSYFEYGVARSIAEHLGALDGEIRAIYLYEDEATPEDAIFGEARSMMIHLIIWAQRKTSALDSLLSALAEALQQSYARVVQAPQAQRLLDVQVVDDAEVNARRGYGALLTSTHFPPLPVWRR